MLLLQVAAGEKRLLHVFCQKNNVGQGNGDKPKWDVDKEG
jgi:hypothetical protein